MLWILDIMIIKNIKLVNYRNYNSLNLDFNNKINIIIGNNAQGKTNILESIYVLALTKSYDKAVDKNLIMFNEKFLKINGLVNINSYNKNFEVLINESYKKVKINNNEISKMKDYISKINVILFTPDDINIFKDSPGSRRRLLNIELSQIFSEYVDLYNKYNVILKQRNEYLKSNNINKLYLDIINEKFVDLAISIINYRLNYINEINNYIKDIFYDITNINDLEIKYITNIEICEDKDIMKDKFLNKLNDNFEREKLYGNSLYGPHRDDFSFFLTNKDLSIYGSQGQLRCAMISYKLSELEIFNKYKKEYPILLLDDVFSELDLNKRNNIIKYLKDDIQTIITTTDIDMIDKQIVSKAKIITIDNGKVIKQEGMVNNE